MPPLASYMMPIAIEPCEKVTGPHSQKPYGFVNIVSNSLGGVLALIGG